MIQGDNIIMMESIIDEYQSIVLPPKLDGLKAVIFKDFDRNFEIALKVV